MALASVGARTPLVTSTPSNAVTLASPALRVRLGTAAMGAPSVVVAFVELSFAAFASLLPATTGTAVMASTNRLESHIFSVDIDGSLLFFRPTHAWAHIWGAKLKHLYERCQGGIALGILWFPFR